MRKGEGGGGKWIVDVDLGFYVSRRIRFRLKGINTLEIFRPNT